jgi:hypothetical protein
MLLDSNIDFVSQPILQPSTYFIPWSVLKKEATKHVPLYWTGEYFGYDALPYLSMRFVCIIYTPFIRIPIFVTGFRSMLHIFQDYV